MVRMVYTLFRGTSGGGAMMYPADTDEALCTTVTIHVKVVHDQPFPTTEGLGGSTAASTTAAAAAPGMSTLTHH